MTKNLKRKTNVPFVTTGKIVETRLNLTARDINAFGYLKKMGWFAVTDHTLSFNKKDRDFLLISRKGKLVRTYDINKVINDEGDYLSIKISVVLRGMNRNGVFDNANTLFTIKSTADKKATFRRIDKYVDAMVQIANERVTRLVCNEFGYPDIQYKEI